MRDFETAAVGISAALTGQLVLTTLHSNDAPRTVERLVELGIDRHAIASALSVVLGQRLLRKLCEHCRRPAPVPEPFAGRKLDGGHFFAAGGCELCARTGYVGRVGVFEVLVVNDVLRDAIATGASTVQIAELGRTCGYEPMFEDGLRRVAAGQTTLEEVRRVVAWDSGRWRRRPHCGFSRCCKLVAIEVLRTCTSCKTAPSCSGSMGGWTA